MDIEPTFKGYIEDEQDALLIIQATIDGKLKHIPRRPYEIERSYLISSGNIFVFVEEISGIKRWTDGVTWSPSRITSKFLIYKEIDKTLTSNKNKLKTLTKKHDHNKNKTKNRKNIIQPTDFTTNEILNKPRIKLPPLVTNNTGRNAQNHYDSMNSTPNSTGSDSNDDSNNEISKNDTTSRAGLSPQLSKSASLRSMHTMKYTGLIKKTISISLKRALLNHTETFHIISYYTIDDVKENRLITPKASLVFRNIKPSDELTIAMENTKLGNTKPLTKGNSISSGSTPNQMAEHTNINGVNYSQHTQHTPHYFTNNGMSDLNNLIQPNTTLTNNSQSISRNVSGTGLNFRNPSKNDDFSLSASSSNNMIPPVAPLYNGSGNNSNGLPPQFSGIQNNRISMSQHSYHNNQALPYAGNMPYMNDGSNNSSMPNNANTNTDFSHSAASQLLLRLTPQGSYPYYYQGQANTNTYGLVDNNGTAPAGQVIPPLSSTFFSSSDTSESNPNSSGRGVTVPNGSVSMMPSVQNNGTYTLYPLNPTPGSSQTSGNTTNGMNSINGGNDFHAPPNNNDNNPAYYSNPVAYSRSSVNPVYASTNNSNGYDSNTGARNDASGGNMIPTPVSLRSKNPGSSSYMNGYGTSSSNNNNLPYSSVSANGNQMGSQYINQAPYTASNNNALKSGTSTYNPPGQYVSNIYTYPGSQQPQSQGSTESPIPNAALSQTLSQYPQANLASSNPYGYNNTISNYALNNDRMNNTSTSATALNNLPASGPEN